ncbi:MAG: TonB family protein [Syntrophobacteraceae bacterium]|jgi:protein TonB|nr:TonB family protein [Syntrophobacteraceae bacterium]
MQLWLGFAISALLHTLIFWIPVDWVSPREPDLPELQLVLIPETCATPEAASVEPASAPQPPPEEPAEPEEPEIEPEPVELPKEPVLTRKPPRPKPPKPKPAPRKKPVAPPEELPQTVEAPPAQQVSEEPGKLAAATNLSAPRGPIDAAFGAGDGPRFLHKAMPRYPRLARELGKEGTVLLRLTIDERGSLTHVEVLKRAGSGFDEEAVRAARDSRFSPARINGKAVACRAQLPVRFVLRSSEND